MALPLAGDPVAAADITRPRYLRKAASEGRTSTTFVNDGDFVNLALAVGVWEVRMYCTVTSTVAGTGDLKTTWNFSGTATVGRCCFGPGNDSTVAGEIATSVNSTGIAIGSTAIYGISNAGQAAGIHEELFLEVTVAGNLTMQWGLSAASGTTTLSSSSRLIITAVEPF